MGQTKRSDGEFRFRVSDSVVVPLRGHLLRLKVVEGTPSMRDLKPGAQLRLVSPSGRERVATIVAHGVPSGKASQSRLDRTRELDVIISNDDAGVDGRTVEIGWFAHGPVRGDDS